ncbi:hypothetical protein WSM22_07590 [Cytophagales bacterium WSM2-2]|nr:hypothetical protein WSM22_07590 [Cytophagales bacterium WSM2-2]
MKTQIITRISLPGLFLSSFIFCFSQSYQDSLKKDDEDIISSIAPYPPDVRDAILNVSQYSQKIVKIERIQSRTSQSFQDMVANYSREEQAKYYEIGRYPDLVHQLVDGPPKTLEQVKPMLANYPQEVVDAVNFLYPMHLTDLASMDKTYQSSQEAVKKITEDLPADAQADFKKVISMPEVMSLLTDRIDLVVSLGEMYKSDPQGTKSKLDAASAQINTQSQKDLADYKKQVESDPKMQQEMKQSAQEFADSYSGNVPDSVQQSQAPVVNNYYSTNYSPNPYPYWFGYPYWYVAPMWYPRPLYYYTGFYFGTRGSVVVTGLPSRAYSGWFFNFGYRRYPRFYSYCNNYYNVHRTFVNNVNIYRGFNTSVNRHFTRINTTNVTRTDTRVTRRTRNNVTVNHQSNGGNRSSNLIRSNAFRNSINQPNINHQSYSRFHATQFHQQSWGNVGGHTGGGARFGGGGHGRR